MLEAHQQLARAALLEITPESTIGAPAGTIDEAEGVVSYLFEVAMNGYPGWKWTVTVANIGEGPASVLEVEMMPAEGALLAPEWIPWADRMDDYRAAQIALGEAAAEDADSDDDEDDDEADAADDDSDDDDESDDETDDDEDDDDDEEDDFVRPTHGGDVDGVDIDQIDESGDDSALTEDDADSDSHDADDSEETVEFDGSDDGDETIEIESAPLPEESEELPTAEPEASEPEVVEVEIPAEEEPVKAPRARRSRRASSADLPAQPTE